MQNEAESLLSGSEYEVDSRAVVGLVQSSDCPTDDLEFIALATKPDIQLVTMDGKLLRAFPKCAAALRRSMPVNKAENEARKKAFSG